MMKRSDINLMRMNMNQSKTRFFSWGLTISLIAGLSLFSPISSKNPASEPPSAGANGNAGGNGKKGVVPIKDAKKNHGKQESASQKDKEAKQEYEKGQSGSQSASNDKKKEKRHKHEEELREKDNIEQDIYRKYNNQTGAGQ